MTAALVVHIGMMLFIPPMAAAVYLLLRGVEGSAALVSRIALVPFVVFFSAWETLQGTANGILASELNGRPEGERASGAELILAKPAGGLGTGSVGTAQFRVVGTAPAATALLRLRGGCRTKSASNQAAGA